MHTIKLEKNQLELIKSFGTAINDNGKFYYNLPCWFSLSESKTVFEIIDENNLPEHVRVRARELRGEPLTPHKCPVCGGTGKVENGFYFEMTAPPGMGEPISPFESCRSCVNGIIWG